MSYDTIPPVPGAGPQWRPEPESAGPKLVKVGVLSFVLTIVSLIVWGYVKDRERDSDYVTGSITGAWGRPASLAGPAVWCADSIAGVTDSLLVNAEVKSRRLHRGIYEAEVYVADVVMQGRIAMASAVAADSCSEPSIRIETGGAVLARRPSCSVDGRQVRLKAEGSSLTASLAGIPLSGSAEFRIELAIKGSEGLYVTCSEGYNAISIRGDAGSPSFNLGMLPDERSVDADSFSASWTSECGTYMDAGQVGVSFLTGVGNYRKVTRSVKYAFIIIVLTFVSLFMAETTLRRPIPLLNYSLIGAALVIFYVLLLAFADWCAFGVAYLVASVMTVGLTGVYMWRMLRSAKAGFTVAGVIAVMYLLCFIMLSAASYALLIGSLLLFGVLALAMRASLLRQ